MQAFLDDGDEHVGARGNPYLCLDGVLAGVQERFDEMERCRHIGDKAGIKPELVEWETAVV